MPGRRVVSPGHSSTCVCQFRQNGRDVSLLKFEPTLHVHYQESVLPIHDSLPKMKVVPDEMGGSGQTWPEWMSMLPALRE